MVHQKVRATRPPPRHARAPPTRPLPISLLGLGARDRHGNLGKFSTAKLEALGWDAKQICRTCVNWQTPMGAELQKKVQRRAKNGVTGADGEDLPTTSHWQGYTGCGAEQLLRRLYCKHVSKFSAGKQSASRLSELGRVKCKLPVSQAPPDVGSRLPDGQLYSCLGLYRSLFMGRVAIGTLYRIDGTCAVRPAKEVRVRPSAAGRPGHS